MEGVLKSHDPDKGTAVLTLPAPFHDKTLTIADPAAAETLAKARKGDIVKFSADDSTKPTQLKQLQEIRRPVERTHRLLALAVAFAVLCLLAAGMLARSPLAFLIGADNRYSNSQTQLALWFAALATAYIATVALRYLYLGSDYIGGVQITENLLALSGLSALSFGGAKVITTQKVQNAAQPNEPVPKPSAARPNLLTDLVQNDRRQADLGDFQMILIALGSVAIFALSTFHFLGELKLAREVTLPDVDSTLLASFGIGQGAYLLKKAALKPGEG
ncbi:MAG: hypothetical protein HYR63_20755 [Proteobacteria bacterium]|nr:hypothetical protein [Pseudomonadota bacterium]MBI3497093.1 hypothetical protein [Pseudomonadota bacterium]